MGNLVFSKTLPHNKTTWLHIIKRDPPKYTLHVLCLWSSAKWSSGCPSSLSFSSSRPRKHPNNSIIVLMSFKIWYLSYDCQMDKNEFMIVYRAQENDNRRSSQVVALAYKDHIAWITIWLRKLFQIPNDDAIAIVDLCMKINILCHPNIFLR